MNHEVWFEGGPLDGYRVVVEELTTAYKVPVYAREGQGVVISEHSCEPSGRGYRTVTYSLTYRTRGRNACPQPVYVTDDPATREQLPLPLPPRGITASRVYLRQMTEEVTTPTVATPEAWTEIGYLDEDAGIGLDDDGEGRITLHTTDSGVTWSSATADLTGITREEIAEAFGIDVETLGMAPEPAREEERVGHEVEFVGGPLDGQVVCIESLVDVFRVPVWDRDENWVSNFEDDDICVTSAMNYRTVNYLLRHRIVPPDPEPRPVYVTEDRATRQQFPIPLPDPASRGPVNGRVFVRPLADGQGVEFGVDFTQTPSTPNSAAFGIEFGRGAQDAPVTAALAHRYCADCDVRWDGGEHCWSCGQPCKATATRPGGGIRDQHGFASWEEY